MGMTMSDTPAPQLTALAPFVRILGRGKSFQRDLTAQEAEEAMGIVLRGEADAHATGALLMLLRMKGETADEIAGFVRAARHHAPVTPEGPAVALDWPTYAAGRTRGLPWFLLAAKLVASAGYPVLLHGWNSHQNPVASVRDALGPLGIPVADTARPDLTGGIAYLPLETFSPALFALLRLRDVLGLRSCINTVLRVLDPAGAKVAVQGVFHPPYRDLQMDAAARLGQASVTIIKGAGGEFERNPAKDAPLFGLREGRPHEALYPALLEGHTRLADGPDRSDSAALADLWRGDWDDDFARSMVLGTADLALATLGAPFDAADLWDSRDRGLS